MRILTSPINKTKLAEIEDKMFFDGWIKCVADIDQGYLAVNAAMHADLQQLLMDNGSFQKSLFDLI